MHAIIVRDGDLAAFDAPWATTPGRGYPTAEYLFERLSRNAELPHPAEAFEFDPDYGYPTEIVLADGFGTIEVQLRQLLIEATRALDSARERWDSAGVVDYDYFMDLLSPCPLRASCRDTIHVRGGEVVGTGTAYRFGDIAGPVPEWTVEDVFDQVGSLIDRGVEQLVVSFDPVSGAVTRIDSDGAAGVADDEFALMAVILAKGEDDSAAWPFFTPDQTEPPDPGWQLEARPPVAPPGHDVSYGPESAPCATIDVWTGQQWIATGPASRTPPWHRRVPDSPFCTLALQLGFTALQVPEDTASGWYRICLDPPLRCALVEVKDDQADGG